MSVKCPKCQHENPSDSEFCKECDTRLLSSWESSISRTKTLKPDKSQVDLKPQVDLKKIGNFKILEIIGKGGMGTVYLAQQEKPIKRKIAIKVIIPGMDTQEVLARFESEQQALAMMNHPNIAQVHDSGVTEQGRPYFVMEYVPGLPITEYCDKYKMTTKERLELFQTVCDAVQHAHYRGIVHRDIKPTNVLVTFQDNRHIPKIIDFGLAKALTGVGLTEKTLHTQCGIGIGTPIYMSPEQAELTGYDIDTRTDVYSLGVLLYELLVGITPFDVEELERAGILEILRVIREDDPLKPSTKFISLGDSSTDIAKKRSATESGMAKQLRGDLDLVIMKALEKDRRRRYSSSAEFAKDIDRYLKNEAIQARSPSIIYKTKKIIRRHKAVSFSLIAILLLVIIFSFWNVLERQKAEKSLKESNYNFALALKEKAILYAEKKQWPLVHLFSANSLLYQARAQKFLFMEDIELPFRYPDLKLKNRIPLGFLPVLWGLTPDLKYIAFAAQAGKIAIWDVSRGRVINSFKVHEGRSGPLCISPDGKYISIGAWDSKESIITVREFPTFKEVISFVGHKLGQDSIIFSPDSKYVATNRSFRRNPSTGEYGGTTIKIWEIHSGKEIVLEGHKEPVLALSFSPDGKHLASLSGRSTITITIWNVPHAKEVFKYAGDGGLNKVMSFSPDGKYLVINPRSDKEQINTVIKILEVNTGKDVRAFFCPKNLMSISFSPDGKYLASANSDGTIRIFNFLNGKELISLEGKGQEVIFLPDGKLATADYRDDQIDIWEISHVEAKLTEEHREKVTHISFSPDGKTLTSIEGNEETLNTWPFLEKGPAMSRSSAESRKHCYSPDGRFFATIVKDGAIEIEKLPLGPPLDTWSIEGPSFNHKDVVMINFSSDGQFLASGDLHGIIKIWDISSNKEVSTIYGKHKPVDSIIFSSDGKYLANYSPSEETIEIMDVFNGKKIINIRGHEKGVKTVGISQDRRYLASSGTDDNIIKVWEINGGRFIANLKAHKSPINSLCFSADGKYLVSGSQNGEIKIWGVSSCNLIITLTGHTDSVNSVALSPNGKYLASGGSDKIINVWNINYFIDHLWRGKDYPIAVEEVKNIITEIEKMTGYVLDGIIPADAKYYFRKGVDSAENDDFDQAIDEYKMALKILPNHFGALNSLGKAHYMIGNYSEAIDFFYKAIDINKLDPSPHFNLALAFLSQDEYERAFEYFRFVVEEIEISPFTAERDLSAILEKKPDLVFGYLIQGYLNKIASNTSAKPELRINKAIENLKKFIDEFKGEVKWKDKAEEMMSELTSKIKGKQENKK